MIEKKKTGGIVACISFDGPGISINEFCALEKIVTGRHGKHVMISVQDKKGYMHLTKDEIGAITGFEYHRHLGYIDINTGSLVWDGMA